MTEPLNWSNPTTLMILVLESRFPYFELSPSFWETPKTLVRLPLLCHSSIPFQLKYLFFFFFPVPFWRILSWWLSDTESAFNAEEPGLIPGLRRSPRGGNGNPLQYFCLENPMNRGTWWAAVGHDWSDLVHRYSCTHSHISHLYKERTHLLPKS